MTDQTLKPSVLYCRVSDPKQALSRGDGLHSQENTCREFAQRKGYAVLDVFTDMATGKNAQRRGLKNVLLYLRKNPGTTVIIDHLNRLGRNVLEYKLLRRDITDMGCFVRSPVMTFEEDSSSMLVENVVASVAKYQSLHNAEQATSRMMARVRNGFNVFQAPAGYRYVAMRGQGKVLQPVEPAASVMREALEGYASGRFEQQADVMRFLQDNPLFPKDKTGRVRHQRVGQLLRCVVYAGMVEAPNWNIERREGQHEGLISYATFLRIQDRLAGKTYAPRQKNLNEDFPLRGFVTCDDCESPLTACWSKGTHSRHPYYLCPKRGCVSYGKSIRRDVIEGEFDELLKTVVPTPGLFAIATRMFKQQWDHQIAHGASQAKQLTAELAKIDKQVGQLLERVMEASLPSVAKAYEAKIAELEDRKLVLREKIVTGAQLRSSFDQTLRTALTFLSNPRSRLHSSQPDHGAGEVNEAHES